MKVTWITPKTDWKSTDYFNIVDYNRIASNLVSLKELVDSKFANVKIEDFAKTKEYTSSIYASEFNSFENDIDTINKATVKFQIGNKVKFIPNGATPDYNELNRIESAMLRLYNTLYWHSFDVEHLEKQIGRPQYGRRTHYSHDEVIGYRLVFRAGQNRGIRE